jgi:hypothetical protein
MSGAREGRGEGSGLEVLGGGLPVGGRGGDQGDRGALAHLLREATK